MSAPSKSPSETVSRREFARLDGCDESLVRRGIKYGKLPLSADGRIARALAGTGWRMGLSPADRGADPSAEKVRTPARVRTSKPGGSAPVSASVSASDLEASAQRLVDQHGVLTLPDAIRLKETYLGRLRQLEYDLKVGTVVLVADVAKAVGAEYATVRTRLLAIPSNIAPAVMRLRTPTEIEGVIRDRIVEALEGLTADTNPAPSNPKG